VGETLCWSALPTVGNTRLMLEGLGCLFLVLDAAVELLNQAIDQTRQGMLR
jgi:hypothetical protein